MNDKKFVFHFLKRLKNEIGPTLFIFQFCEKMNDPNINTLSRSQDWIAMLIVCDVLANTCTALHLR